jgi:hypothetical protein
LNTAEVVNEQWAKKAMAALREFAEPSALVLREGHAQEVPQEQQTLHFP